MKNKITVIAILIISLLTSCSQEESKLTVIPELPSEGNINLSNIKEGQNQSI